MSAGSVTIPEALSLDRGDMEGDRGEFERCLEVVIH
jgi:hypothetical protein